MRELDLLTHKQTRIGEMEKMVGGEEEVVMGGKRGRRGVMGNTSRSIKLAALLLFSVATVAGKPILMMVILTFYDADDDDWIFGWHDKMSYFWIFETSYF